MTQKELKDYFVSRGIMRGDYIDFKSARLAQDAIELAEKNVIGKAIKWLEEHWSDYILWDECFESDKMIGDFRKEMEGKL